MVTEHDTVMDKRMEREIAGKVVVKNASDMKDIFQILTVIQHNEHANKYQYIQRNMDNTTHSNQRKLNEVVK